MRSDRGRVGTCAGRSLRNLIGALFVLGMVGSTAAQVPTSGFELNLVSSFGSPGGVRLQALAAGGGRVYVRAHNLPGGNNVLTYNCLPGLSCGINTPFQSPGCFCNPVKNSDLSGLVVDPLLLPLGFPALIVADESANRIVSYATKFGAITTLYYLPWVLNPAGNGNGQIQFATDSANASSLYFYDNSTAKVYLLDRAAGSLTELYDIGDGQPDGFHSFGTFYNDIRYDTATGTLLLGDNFTGQILELDVSFVPAVVTNLLFAVGPFGGGRPANFGNLEHDPGNDRIYVVHGTDILYGPRSGGVLTELVTGFPFAPRDIVLGPASGGVGLGDGLSLYALVAHPDPATANTTGPGFVYEIRGEPADSGPPVVDITSPADGAIVGDFTVAVTADVVDESDTTVVSIPGGIAGALPAGGGAIGGTLPLLVEGDNVLAVSATDVLGNVGGSSITVIRDTTPPAINVLAPAAGTVVAMTPVSLSIEVDDATAADLTFGSNSVALPPGTNVANGDVDLVDGANSITVTAVDAAGNTTTVIHGLVLDQDAPLVTIDSPADGVIVGPGASPIAVTATVDDLTATTVGSTPAGVSDTLPAGGGIVVGAIDLVEGANAISVFADDQAGLSGSDSILVVLDTTPPTVAIDSPVDGDAIRGEIDFDASATDAAPGAGITVVDFFVDGNLSASFGISPYESSIDTTLLSDGVYTLSITAVDGVGNTGSDSIVALVDNTGPTLAIDAPLDGSIVSGTIAFDVSGFDAGAGLTEVTMLAAGAAPSIDDSVVFGTPQISTLRMGSEDTTRHLDGPLTLSASAVDAAGNVSVSSISVEVDNTAPEKTLLAPVAGTLVEGTVSIVADAEDANLAAIEILVDGSSLGSSAAAPFIVDYDTTLRLDGAMTVTVVATDLAGNSSACSASVTVGNVEWFLTPRTLNLDSKGKLKSVTAHLEGESLALLLPTEANAIELLVPGGSSVPATVGFAGDDALADDDGDGVPELTVKFDRQLLIASIQAGIAAGVIEPRSRIPVTLVAGGGFVYGTDIIRIIGK